MRRTISLMVALAATVAVATAKDLTLGEWMEERTNARGMLFNRDLMTISDMVNLSQSDYTYGTARSMGLSGAMTSLGADPSAMNINPAGLGMYRSTEVSVSPQLMINKTGVNGADQSGRNRNTNFGLSNFSLVTNMRQSGVSNLTTLNFGFSYNRTANFDQQYTVENIGASSSVANLFSRQLTSLGVPLEDLFGSKKPDWSKMPTSLWGAALGYKAGLTFQTHGETPDGYNTLNPSGTEWENYREPITASNDVAWDATWIPTGATVDQHMTYESEGGAYEFAFSMGGNINNSLYFGATLGVQSIAQRIDLFYNEYYNGGTSGTTTPILAYSKYNQAIITKGAGVNAKFGLTYRKEDLRIGLAYHTPTAMSFERKYQTSVVSSSKFTESTNKEVKETLIATSPLLEDDYSNQWHMNTPRRLLMGASYVFDLRAMLSFDYQIDFYRGMKMKRTPDGVSKNMYSGISDILNNVYNYRLGGEYKLTPVVTLRGGAGFSSAVIDDSKVDQVWDIPLNNSTWHYSAGLGFMMAKWAYFDIAYMRQTTQQSDYSLFWGEGSLNSNAPSAASAQSMRLNSRSSETNIVATLRFYM